MFNTILNGPLVQTRSAAEGLDVQLIVIGDTEDPDCAHYELMVRNTGALLDSVPPPRPEEVLLVLDNAN